MHIRLLIITLKMKNIVKRKWYQDVLFCNNDDDFSCFFNTAIFIDSKLNIIIIIIIITNWKMYRNCVMIIAMNGQIFFSF